MQFSKNNLQIYEVFINCTYLGWDKIYFKNFGITEKEHFCLFKNLERKAVALLKQITSKISTWL